MLLLHWFSEAEFEWNPFSPISRAARALRRGQAGVVVRLCAEPRLKHLGSREATQLLIQHLSYSCPDGKLRSYLIKAAADLPKLVELAASASGSGAPETIKVDTLEYAVDTAELLWSIATRVAVAADLGINHNRIENELRSDIESLSALVREEGNENESDEGSYRKDLENLILHPGAAQKQIQDLVTRAGHLRASAQGARAGREWADAPSA